MKFKHITKLSNYSKNLLVFITLVIIVSTIFTLVSIESNWIPVPNRESFIIWFTLSLATSLAIIKLPVGGGIVTSLGEIVDIAAFVSIGPLPILLSNVFGSFGRSIILKRSEPIRDIFNFSLWNLASLCAYFSFKSIQQLHTVQFSWLTLAAILITWFVYSTITTIHVSTIVAITHRNSIILVWWKNYAREFLVSFTSAPLALVMAVLFLDYGFLPVLILVIPLFVLSLMLSLWLEKTRLKAKNERNNKLTEMGKITASLFHEMSKPLSRILMTSDFALSGGIPLEKALDIIYKEASGAKRISERMINLDSLSIKKTSVTINKLIAKLEQQLEQDNIPLMIEAEPTTLKMNGQWDIDLLSAAIYNLVKNAWESQDYKAPAPVLSVNIKYSLIESNSSESIQNAIFCVTDHGAGITSDTEVEVFEALYTTKKAGFGIGLYLSNQIVVAHGGSLSINDSPEGANICLSIPLFD